MLLLAMLTTTAWAQSSNALNGEFTVSSSGRRVVFSKGNLQQIDGTWQFAEHQYDYLGTTQDINSTTRDVFAYNSFSKPGDDASWYNMSRNEWRHLLLTRSVTNTLSDGARYTMATIW